MRKRRINNEDCSVCIVVSACSFVTFILAMTFFYIETVRLDTEVTVLKKQNSTQNHELDHLYRKETRNFDYISELYDRVYRLEGAKK